MNPKVYAILGSNAFSLTPFILCWEFSRGDFIRALTYASTPEGAVNSGSGMGEYVPTGIPLHPPPGDVVTDPLWGVAVNFTMPEASLGLS